MTFRPETRGNAAQRLVKLQRTLDSWAVPLVDPAPLRFAVMELVDIVKQLDAEIKIRENVERVMR